MSYSPIALIPPNVEWLSDGICSQEHRQGPGSSPHQRNAAPDEQGAAPEICPVSHLLASHRDNSKLATYLYCVNGQGPYTVKKG
jgi:hypothetical protein